MGVVSLAVARAVGGTSMGSAQCIDRDECAVTCRQDNGLPAGRAVDGNPVMELAVFCWQGGRSARMRDSGVDPDAGLR